MNWVWKKFKQLSVEELYDILKLRQDVFVIEQNCVYADIDELDKTSWHLLGLNKGSLCAYCRVLPANQQHQISIGRVITSQKLRGQGVGKQVIQQSLDFIAQKYSNQGIKISAQVRLKKFYGEFGFTKVSEPYDEDGIMHIDMLLEN